MVDAGKPWFGVIDKIQRDGQLLVHHYQFAPGAQRTSIGASIPLWINDAGRLKLSRIKPNSASWKAATYICSDTTLISSHPRIEAQKWVLPQDAVKSIADYARNLR